MPPAPAGGSVGMGANGGWTTNSGPRGGDNRNSRIPGAAAARMARPNAHGNQGNSFRRSDSRSNEPYTSRARPGPEDSNRAPAPWAKDGGLPPKPPVPSHQPWAASHGRSGRDRPYQSRSGPRPEGAIDSYHPNYSGDRRRDSEGRASNIGSDRSGRRDYARDNPPRRRSRSPYSREGSRPGDRPSYR
jgi:serine/threonine-protein kinase BUR1